MKSASTVKLLLAAVGLLTGLLVPVAGVPVARKISAHPCFQHTDPNSAHCLDAGSCLNTSGTNCPAQSQTQDSVNNVITNGINIFSAIVGVVAVVMMIFGGFRYITAGGDSGKINSAQQTIIYAVVGLVVVALAQIIVRFVLSESTREPEALLDVLKTLVV
jgi:hypothetical protein